MPARRSRPIDGNATLTTVASSSTIASPSTATASTQRPAAEASRTEPGPPPSFPTNRTLPGRSWLPYDPESRRYEPGHEEKVIAQPSHGGLNTPSWFMIAAMSSAAHSSLMRPSRMR